MRPKWREVSKNGSQDVQGYQNLKRELKTVVMSHPCRSFLKMALFSKIAVFLNTVRKSQTNMVNWLLHASSSLDILDIKAKPQSKG